MICLIYYQKVTTIIRENESSVLVKEEEVKRRGVGWGGDFRGYKIENTQKK